jgi:hypothetical protein
MAPHTREEALILLNDRCGQEVEVYVMTDASGVDTIASRQHPQIVVSAVGTLQHWRQVEDAEKWANLPQDHWLGAYTVGDVHFNVTALTELELDFDADGRPWSYRFSLGDHADLLVVWQPDSLSAP